MTQMNLPMKQKETHRCREQNYGCQWGGMIEEGWTESLVLADTNYYIQNGWKRRSYGIAQGTTFNIF